MDQAQIEEIFSRSLEQLREMSLMDLVQQGGAVLLKQAVAEEIRSYWGRGYDQHGGAESRPGYRNGVRWTEVEVGNGVIGRHPSEAGCLALVYKISERYARRRRGFKIDPISQMLWKRLREQQEMMLQQLVLEEKTA